MSSWPRRILIGAPYLWLLALFLSPFAIVLRISLSDPVIDRPPYAPQFGVAEGIGGLWTALGEFDLENFAWLASDALYINSYLSSLWIAAVSTFLTLLIAFPIAYGIARAPREWRPGLIMAVILPFWISFLIRIYSLQAILANEGFLNTALMGIGLIDAPIPILATDRAVYVGMIYGYLSLVVLPIYASLERLDEDLLEAAEDLGCSQLSAFWLVTVPLAMPGIVAGCLLMFIPAVGEFVIPELLGGAQTLMIGKTLWTEFFNNRDWPVASAVAIVMLIILIAPIVLFQRHQQRMREAE